MNDILISALKTNYCMTDDEANTRIKRAKEKGKLLELYQIALIKLEMEMKDNV